MNRAPYRRLLSADVGQILANLQEDIEARKAALQEAESAYKLVRQRAGELNAQVQRAEQQARNINAEGRRLNKLKNDVEAQLSSVQAAKEVDTSGLEREAEELKQAIETVERQEEERKAGLDGLNREQKDLKAACREAEVRRDALIKQVSEHERQLERFISSQEAKRRAVERARIDVSRKDKQWADGNRAKEQRVAVRDQRLQIATEKVRKLPSPLITL
jgi:chromosome segregation ATPase